MHARLIIARDLNYYIYFEQSALSYFSVTAIVEYILPACNVIHLFNLHIKQLKYLDELSPLL